MDSSPSVKAASAAIPIAGDHRRLARIATLLAWSPLVLTVFQWIVAWVCTAEVGTSLTYELPGVRNYSLSPLAEFLSEIAAFTMIVSLPLIIAAIPVLLVAMRQGSLSRRAGALFGSVLVLGVASWYASLALSASFAGFVDWMLD